MPYIAETERTQFDTSINELAEKINSSGQLNYVISKLCHELLLKKKRLVNQDPTYTDFNAIIGVLECAKLEFYRAVVAPYEKTKITESGWLTTLDEPKT